MKNLDFLSRLAKLVGLDREEATKKMESMPVDAATSVLDAVKNNDAAAAKELLGIQDKPKEADDIEGDNVDGDDIDHDLNPLFTAAKGDDEDIEGDFTDDEIYKPNFGDEVAVRIKNDDGQTVVRRGTVKIANAPKRSIGVNVNGELIMVKKKNVAPIKEGVMGMTDMGSFDGLNRLRALAGLPPQDIEGSVEASIELDPQPAPTATLPVAETPAPTAPCDDLLSKVMSCFAEIESVLPELKLRDAREVRARINTLSSKLNESSASKIRR